MKKNILEYVNEKKRIKIMYLILQEYSIQFSPQKKNIASSVYHSLSVFFKKRQTNQATNLFGLNMTEIPVGLLIL